MFSSVKGSGKGEEEFEAKGGGGIFYSEMEGGGGGSEEGRRGGAHQGGSVSGEGGPKYFFRGRNVDQAQKSLYF